MQNYDIDNQRNVFKRLSFYEILDTVVLSAVFVLLAFTLVFRIFVVSGPSMNPTLNNGDRLIVSNLFYTPKTGDIICFYSQYKDEVLIKRVIATEGQTVDIGDDLCVYVNGLKLNEPYIAGASTFKSSTPFPYTVAPGTVLVMGDNRMESLDSRDSRIGPVKLEDIVGRLVLRISPKFGKVN